MDLLGVLVECGSAACDQRRAITPATRRRRPQLVLTTRLTSAQPSPGYARRASACGRTRGDGNPSWTESFPSPGAWRGRVHSCHRSVRAWPISQCSGSRTMSGWESLHECVAWIPQCVSAPRSNPAGALRHLAGLRRPSPGGAGARMRGTGPWGRRRESVRGAGPRERDTRRRAGGADRHLGRIGPSRTARR
jgi:hypothetical protein